MSSESQSRFNDSNVEALFSALGGSIDRVLQTTNSVKIRGLGVFRKGDQGISFEASEDLESFVNIDFEGLDIVSYDPSDLARSHLKREEFSFEEEEFSSASRQTEIVTPLVLSTDSLASEVVDADLITEEVISESLEKTELEVLEESSPSSDEEINPFDIEAEPPVIEGTVSDLAEEIEVEEMEERSQEEASHDIEEISELEEEVDQVIEEAEDLSHDENFLGNIKPELETEPETELEIDKEDQEEDDQWLPKDDPEWMKEEEQASKPFVLPIKKSEKEFAEKGDDEIRERRENAKSQRRRQKKRRLSISIIGLLFVIAALSLFWWLINSGTLQNPLDNRNQTEETTPIQNSRQNAVALDREVIEPAEEDSLYLDIPVIDYSNPDSESDLERGKFTWILYSSNERRDALARSKFYRDSGFENDVIKVNLRGLDTYRVSFGRFSGFRQATEADSTLPNGIQGTWVDKLEDSFKLSQGEK